MHISLTTILLPINKQSRLIYIYRVPTSRETKELGQQAPDIYITKLHLNDIIIISLYIQPTCASYLTFQILD